MVKTGVPLFDWLEFYDLIWVYYPTARYEGLGSFDDNAGWYCDLIELNRGELTAVKSGLRFSDRFLESLRGMVPSR